MASSGSWICRATVNSISWPSNARCRDSSSGPPTRPGSPFKAFRSLPNVDWNDPNLRFLDLTGDGLPDLLITEDHAFHWHASLGEDGFDRERRVAQPPDEEKGPRFVFSNEAESIFVADMSGDGLVDLVRVRNGEVCYWPNLGYGRFGAKIVMDRSPRFDRPELFDGRRLQLADIDGTGTSDIIYFTSDGSVDLYFNQSGNTLRRASHADPVSFDRQRLVRHGRRSPGQRDRVSRLVIAAAGAHPQADAVHRPDERQETAPADPRPQQPGRGDGGAVRAVDEVLRRRQACGHARG